MQQPDITAQREGKTVIVSKAVRLTAEDILAMELKDGETVTLEGKKVIHDERLLGHLNIPRFQSRRPGCSAVDRKNTLPNGTM